MGRGFILTTDDSSAWNDEIQEAWNERGTDDPVDSERLLDRVKDLSRERIERLILIVNAGRIRQEDGDGSISVKELATRMGIGVSTLYRVYGKDILGTVLRPDVNESFITTEEERDQAKVAKFSKQFSWRNDGEGSEDFFNDEASELRSVS
jgi:hypothetical protein